MLLRSLHRPPSLHYSPCSFLRKSNAPTLHNSARPTAASPKIQFRRIQLGVDIKTSGSNITIGLLITASVLLSGSVVLKASLSASPHTETGDPPHSVQFNEEREEVNFKAGTAIEEMPGAVLPGRPGNLTSDQQAKLQELWSATLRIFGVAAPSNGVDGVDSLAEADEKSKLSAEKQPKKKRVGLFGKRQRGDGNGNGSPDGQVDLDDKYGQTKEFHDVLANQSPEDLRKAFWSMVKHDHPDGLLLRFLRARKWDVQKALIMMIATMHWRLQEMHVDDDIIVRGEGGAAQDSASSNADIKKEGNDFLAQMRLGKSFLHGTDKEGRPMCFVRARLHKQGEQSERSLERYTVFVIESARLMLASPVDTAAIVFDMTDFSMANMDYAPVKFMIKVFEANYPESLGVVLVHKSPWIFHGIWSIIKGWLDPVVASKVHFTKNVEELEAFVERRHIIKELGGDDPWTYQYVEPTPSENDQMHDTAVKEKLLEERAALVKDFESLTQDWIKEPKAAEQRRSEVAERLRAGYWQLDPYVRARSLYDRTGVIRNGGKIQHYATPSTGVTTTISAQNGPLPTQHRQDDVD